MAKFKKGQIVAAKAEDGVFYEAEIVSILKSGKIKVDFGEGDTIIVDPKKKEIEEIETPKDKEEVEEEEILDDIDTDDIDSEIDDEIEEEVEEDEEVEDEDEEEDEVEDDDEEIEEDEEEDEKPKKSVSGAWYAVGDSKDETDFKEIKTVYQNRFYLEKGHKKKVIILNPEPITFREHQVKINGKWTNWFTCIGDTDERCPLCENQNKSSVVKGFYALDPEGYFSKKDNEQKKNVEVLLVMKTQSYEPFKTTVIDYFEDKKISFAGLKVTISRSNSKNSPNTGDVFTVTGKDLKTYKARKKTIEDLAEVFVPKTRKDLLKIANMEEDSED
jgi:hypothetical protein